MRMILKVVILQAAVLLPILFAGQLVAEESPKIDVSKQPWLVEAARGAPKQKHRMMWADSVKFKPIAEVVGGPIEVERWVNTPPKDIAGKFVLIEVWATWCPPCRRSLAMLDFYHEKYKDELVVVSICETDEEALKKMEGPTKLADIKAPLAVDTHRRFANALGVWGIPHVVLIEPIHGAVVWEGMPTFAGYELTDQMLGKILANLKRPAIQAKLPKTAPFEFKACPPDPNKPNERPKTEARCAGGDDGNVVDQWTCSETTKPSKKDLFPVEAQSTQFRIFVSSCLCEGQKRPSSTQGPRCLPGFSSRLIFASMKNYRFPVFPPAPFVRHDS